MYSKLFIMTTFPETIEVAIVNSDVIDAVYKNLTDCGLGRAFKRMYPTCTILVGGSFLYAYTNNSIYEYAIPADFDAANSWNSFVASQLQSKAKLGEQFEYNVTLVFSKVF